MPFWSRQRLLRNAATPRHAAAIVIVTAAVACAACTAPGLPAVRLDPLWPAALAAGMTAGFLTLAAFVDSVCQILPDPLLVLAACAAFLYGLALGQQWEGLATGATTTAIAWLVSATSGMGRGDAKLCGVIGLWLADPLLTVGAIFAGTAAAGAYAIALACAGAIDRRSTLPLGPWLAGGAILAWYACLAGL